MRRARASMWAPYFFSQAVSVEEAREEAEFVLRLLGRPLPGAARGVRPRARRRRRGSCEQHGPRNAHRVRAGVLRTPRAGRLRDDDLRQQRRYGALRPRRSGRRPVWFAEYDAAEPHAQFDFAIWQYTNGGSVPASAPPSTSTFCCRPRSKTRPWHVHRFVIHWPSLFARNHEEHARWLVAFSAKSLSRFAIHPRAARSRNA